MAEKANAPASASAPRNVQKSRYSLPEMTYDKILAAVIDGRYPLNSKLPSEVALATEIGVSRPVLRAALGRLKTDGIIASRQGSGNYVLRQPHHAVLLIAPLSSIGDVQNGFKFRVGLEGEAAFYAALHYGEADRAAIATSLEALREAARRREPAVQLDYDFHMKIAEASDNPYFVAALSAIHDQVAFAMNITRRLSLRRSEARFRQVNDEHQEICDSIFARDAEGARNAMRKHLENARHRLFESDLMPAGGNRI